MTQFDLYCERLDPGLLAEPVNALTNAAFFVAAWLIWRQAPRSGELAGDVRVLLALVLATGVGSTLFHIFATIWARWLDELPILLFQLAFLWSYSRRALRWTAGRAAMLLATLLFAALYARRFPQLLNGTLTYAPAIVTLLALSLCGWRQSRAGSLLLLAAAGVFMLSLLLRTADNAMCAQFPLGTHFGWHLLNAVVIYLAVRGLVARR